MIETIFEDNHIIVCIKPYGVSSQGTAHGGKDMVEILSEQTGFNIKPVHRLDTNVGGTMVYAKTDLAARVLSTDIQSRESFGKCYIAVINGRPEEDEGTFCDWLYKNSIESKAYIVKNERKGVKKASLEYKVLDSISVNDKTLSLLFIRLHTGRFHQIRAQFASRKMPLVGDGKYGSKDNNKTIALWSYSLCFKHPEDRRDVYFSSFPKLNEAPWSLFGDFTKKI